MFCWSLVSTNGVSTDEEVLTALLYVFCHEVQPRELVQSVAERAGRYRAERPALTQQLDRRPDVKVLV